MIHTFPLPHTHRDRLSRVIRRGDYGVWTNRKYGSGLNTVEVVSSTPRKVKVTVIGEETVYTIDPDNMIVITAQIERNMEGNVGANKDLEELRNA